MSDLTLEAVKEIIHTYASEIQNYPTARQLIMGNPQLPKEYARYVRLYGMSIMDIIKSCNLQFKLKEKSDKYTDKQIIELYKMISTEIGQTASFSDIDEYRKNNKNIPSANTMRDRFGGIENLAQISGLYTTKASGKYKKDFLINELKRFFNEHRKIPTQKEIDIDKNYPSRKTFTSVFGTFNNALREAGFDVKDRPEFTKEYLLSEIQRFINEFGKQPYGREMDVAKGYPAKHVFEKVFGSWNNAIKEAGLKVRASHYTDEELDRAFFRFVEIHGRHPVLQEFNDNSDYPSFWCYQNRYGSWNKTVIHYGFEPNEGNAGSHYEFSNGEVCKSKYEFDTSTWLRKNNISYLRNLHYGDSLDWYEGKKDCDYVIIHNGEWIFLEIAGLYTTREKKSSMEKDYIKRFDHKLENLLCEFNYRVFYPDDFKKRTLDEMFSFLWDIPQCPWNIGEPIYQGIPEEIDFSYLYEEDEIMN